MGSVDSELAAVKDDMYVPSLIAAAHELKSPLVLMRQLSLELAGSGMTRTQTKAVERLLLTSERSLRLVNAVTQASRLEDVLFDLEPLRAQTICEAVAEELQPLALEHSQKIVVSAPKNPLMTVGHRTLLTSILAGLCDNAISYSSKDSTVVIGARRRGREIIFSVSDDGPDVSRKTFNSLKDRLGKGPQPLGSRGNSSGLGLWVADQFARSMASRLTVIKRKRGGMIFGFSMPISEQLSLL